MQRQTRVALNEYHDATGVVVSKILGDLESRGGLADGRYGIVRHTLANGGITGVANLIIASDYLVLRVTGSGTVATRGGALVAVVKITSCAGWEEGRLADTIVGITTVRCLTGVKWRTINYCVQRVTGSGTVATRGGALVAVFKITSCAGCAGFIYTAVHKYCLRRKVYFSRYVATANVKNSVALIHYDDAPQISEWRRFAKRWIVAALLKSHRTRSNA
jgi:hypothetical protein